jgi:hypothetical protein
LRISQLIVVSTFLLASISRSVVEFEVPGQPKLVTDQVKMDSAAIALPCPLLPKWLHCRPMAHR